MRKFRITAGQSIVFMAILLLILIAFTGLTVDTGNAFQRQRTLQAASSAAAVSGMNDVLLQQQDIRVAETVRNQMIANGTGTAVQQIPSSANWTSYNDKDLVYYKAVYLDNTGTYLRDVGSGGTANPYNFGANYVQVWTRENVATTFASVFGTDKYTVGAQGIAGLCACVQGIYPVTFDEDLIEEQNVVPLNQRYWDASAADIYANAPQSIIHVSRTQNPQRGDFLWLNWDPSNSSANGLGNSMRGAGNLADGFTEATPPSGDTVAQSQLNHQLEVGDWIQTKPGNARTIESESQWHVDNKTIMIIPLHDTTNDLGGSNLAFHISRLAKVRLLNIDYTGNPKSMDFALLSTDANCSCRVSPPATPPNYVYTMHFDTNLRWIDPASAVGNYDFVMVEDISGSMRFCWDSDTVCPVGSRRIDLAESALRDFVIEMLETRVATQGANNRLALIRYGLNVSGLPGSRARYGADVTVGLTTDVNAFFTSSALGARNATSSPLPTNAMDGYTATTHGLETAALELNNARSVDVNGNPVKLVVLIISDGLTNVYHGGSDNGKINRVSCLSGSGSNISPAQSLNSAYAQRNCSLTQGVDNPTNLNAPIIAAIRQADSLRARYGDNIGIYAIGLVGVNNISDTGLDLIAPGAVYKANSTADIQAMIDNIKQRLGSPCQPHSLLTTVPNVQVTFTQSGSGSGGQTVNADANGNVSVSLPAGTYYVRATVTAVAPEDTQDIPRTYNRIRTAELGAPASQITIVMPSGQNYVGPDATLEIDDESNAACP